MLSIATDQYDVFLFNTVSVPWYYFQAELALYIFLFLTICARIPIFGLDTAPNYVGRKLLLYYLLVKAQEEVIFLYIYMLNKELSNSQKEITCFVYFHMQTVPLTFRGSLSNFCATVNSFTFDRIRLNVPRVLPGLVELFYNYQILKGLCFPYGRLHT